MRKAPAMWLAALVALGAAGGVMAEQPDPAPGGMMGPGMMGPGMMGMESGDWGAMPMTMGRGAMPMLGMGRHVEGRLAFLKTELKITPDQEPLWEALAQTLRANARTMAGMMPKGGTMAQGERPSLPARLDRQEAFLTARLEALRATKEALLPLYAAFSDAQKRTADELVGGPMGMGMAM